MKQYLIIWPTLVLTALFLPKSTLVPTKALTADNPTNTEATVYPNPLLNSQPVDYGTFSMASKGILTVVSGNPETAQSEKVPFRIYLRRNGSVVENSASDPTNSVLEIDVASVLTTAKPDDYLVIEPVRASDSRARRVIKLKPFFNSDLLLNFFRKSGDGC